MSLEWFVATRYLFGMRKQTFISLISFISIAGVGLGVAALIIVMGVMNGFSADLHEKILGADGHAIIFHSFTGFPEADKAMEILEKQPDFVGATPVVFSEVLISSSRSNKGLVVRGIDPAQASQVLRIFDHIVDGDISYINTPPEDLPDGADALRMPGLLIGQTLARQLDLEVNSIVNLLSPAGRVGPTGSMPKVMRFRVAGIFKTGMAQFDSSFGYMDIEVARSLMGFPKDYISAIEVSIKDPDKVDAFDKAIRGPLSDLGMYSRTWQNANVQFFAALKLEKLASSLVLLLIILVGAFSIITALAMLVMKKTRDIALLMAMGATPKAVSKIFVLQGTLIGFLGTTIGFTLGLGISWLLSRYKFIELPPGVYSVDHVPILLQVQDLVVVAVVAMLLCMLATIYPAWKASKLEPATALRFE